MSDAGTYRSAAGTRPGGSASAQTGTAAPGAAAPSRRTPEAAWGRHSALIHGASRRECGSF